LGIPCSLSFSLNFAAVMIWSSRRAAYWVSLTVDPSFSCMLCLGLKALLIDREGDAPEDADVIESLADVVRLL